MHARRNDRGETLIELLISLVVLTVAAVAIFEGVRVSIIGSDTHRKQTSAGIYLRDYAETIENTVAGGAYATAYTAGIPNYAAYTIANSNFTAAITSAQCGPGTSWTTCSAATDVGLQRLTLRVATKDGRASEQLTVVVRKPCGPGSSC